MLCSADVVLFAPGWENSKGCKKEMEACGSTLSYVTLDHPDLSTVALFSIAHIVNVTQWKNRKELKYPPGRYPDIELTGGEV